MSKPAVIRRQTAPIINHSGSASVKIRYDAHLPGCKVRASVAVGVSDLKRTVRFFVPDTDHPETGGNHPFECRIFAWPYYVDPRDGERRTYGDALHPSSDETGRPGWLGNALIEAETDADGIEIYVRSYAPISQYARLDSGAAYTEGLDFWHTALLSVSPPESMADFLPGTNETSVALETVRFGIDLADYDADP